MKNIADIAERMSLRECADATWLCLRNQYDERPVTVETFVTDPHFLGGYFKGRSRFWPFWLDTLKDLYPTEFHALYEECVWSLPIGSGKSLTATSVILYEIHKLLCLKNPNTHYGLAPSVPIAFALFSATLSLSQDVNWEYFEGLLEASPYFQEKSALTKSKGKTVQSVDFPKNIRIMLGSTDTHALGKATFGGILDEANFQRVQSEQAKRNYLALTRRRSSRFMQQGGSVPGMFFLLSSPTVSSGFVDQRIEAVKKNPAVHVIRNTPRWEIHRGSDKDVYSGKTFTVFLGDSQHDPRIVPEGERPPVEGRILEVPVEYYADFTSDLLSSIRDIAGFSIASSSAFFPSEARIRQAAQVKHRFTKEVIALEFSTPKRDLVMDYMDREHFGRLPFRDLYRFLHLDAATSRDRLALASVFAVPDRKLLDPWDARTEVSKYDRTYITDFLLYVEAKPGQEIPLEKILDFILYLKKTGYPIFRVTADQYQSKHLLQQLEVSGIRTDHVSVDRDRFPYVVMRTLIHSGKLLLPRSELLVSELLGLEDDGQKIDHRSDTSKDGSDAIAGALYGCFGETVIATPMARVGAAAPRSERMSGMLETARRVQELQEMAKKLFLTGVM